MREIGGFAVCLHALLRRRTVRAVARSTSAFALAAVALSATATFAHAATREPGYPPTPPCALSVSTAAMGDRVPGPVQLAVTATGLGALEQVALTLDPSAVRIASFRADETGAFTGRFGVGAAQLRAAHRIRAASATASCWAQPPFLVPPNRPGPQHGSSPTEGAAPIRRGLPPGPEPSTAPPGSRSPSAGPSSAVSQPGPGASFDLSPWVTFAAASALLVVGGLALLLLTRRRG